MLSSYNPYITFQGSLELFISLMTSQIEVPIEIKSKIDKDIEYLLFTKGRKFYLRLKRNKSGAGVLSTYLEFLKSANINREDADDRFYMYLERKYPELVKLVKEHCKDK